MGRRETVKGCRVSFEGNHNVPKWTAVMVAEFCDYPKSHGFGQAVWDVGLTAIQLLKAKACLFIADCSSNLQKSLTKPISS